MLTEYALLDIYLFKILHTAMLKCFLASRGIYTSDKGVTKQEFLLVDILECQSSTRFHWYSCSIVIDR